MLNPAGSQILPAGDVLYKYTEMSTKGGEHYAGT